MSWELFAMLVAKEGIPVAVEIVRKWQAKGEVTVAEAEALEAMTRQTARDRAIAMLQRRGVDPESERGKEFLELVG